MENQNLQQSTNHGGQTTHRNNLVSHLMRTLLFLAIIVMGAGNAWGQTSLGKMEFTSYPANGSDGTFNLFTNENFTAGCIGLTKETNTIDGKFLIKLGSVETDCFELNFSEGVVKVGDIIRVECGCIYKEGTPELGFIVNGHSKTGTPSTNDEIITLDYTIQAGDIVDGTDGKKKIQIKRNDYSTGYHSIELLAVQRYSVTLSTKDATTGCDAWFTLGDDATQHRGTVNYIVAGTKVVFHGSDTGADHSLMNGWRKAGTNGNEGWLKWGATYTVNSLDANLNYAAEFWSAYRIFANAENGATAIVYTNTSTKDNISGRKHHDNITETLYFSTNVPEGYTFDGWSNGSTIVSSANPYGYGTYTSQYGTTDLTLTAKFKANALDVSCGYGSEWRLTLGTDYKNWNLPPFNVKVGGTTIDASNYTLSYEVVSGPITLNENKVSVNEGTANEATTAQIRITATPKAGTSYASYTAGTALLNVDIKPVSNVKITINKREIRVGEAATIGVTRGTGFSNPVYRWTFGTNAGDFLHLPTLTDGAYVVHQAGGSDNPTFELVGKAPTTGNIDVNLQFSSDNGATEYKGTYGNGITVKPITKPTITQEGSKIKFTYEEDYGQVDAYLEYFVGTMDDSNRVQQGLGQSDGTYTATDIPADSKVYAKSVVSYTDPNGTTQYAASEVVEFTVFNPALDLNSSDKGSNVVSYENGVLTVKGSSDNGVKVKDLTGQGNNYTGIRLTTQGDACRIIVRWGERDETQKATVVDASTKATTSYYSWSMLGVPENQVANLTSIRFFGAADGSYSDSNKGVTRFTNASLVNVTETSPYTKRVGDLTDFKLNDTRVQLYGHGEHYQMGGNINWVYKVETDGDKFVTMKTTGTSYNQMEIFNSGHGASNADGVCINHKGQHFRVIVYTTDKDAEDNNIKFTYTVSASDSKTETFLPWAMFKKDGVAMTAADVSKILRIEVAGCSDHSDEEAVNFYGLRLHKDLAEVIYTDESRTIGSYNGSSHTLTYTETLDGKNMRVVFNGVTSQSDRHADCKGVIMTNSTVNNFVLDAPAGHKIAKVTVGLGESTNSKATFNGADVTVSGDKVEWTNNTATESVTMSIPGDAANALHVTYIYYELAELEINKIEVNGMTRQYDVYVPEGITFGTVGVVFSLHGASKDYYDDSGRINFNAIADAQKTTAKKFIVVYPRGIMRELRGQERGWATYNEDNVEDVEFFKAIVTELKKTYTVDMNRIYLAGYANGGMMAYKAAHQAGDFFKAFASVGGFPVNESHLYHAGSQPTPFIHIQGEEDEIFNSTEYNFFTISHNMTYRNGAHFNAYDTTNNSDGGVVPNNANVTREIHVADEGGAAYFLYYIKNMTHVPAYNWDGVDGDDVAQSIWNFFDYSGKVNNIDPTLKFRMNDPGELWHIATTGESTTGTPLPDGGYIGFDNVFKGTGTSVLSYGGRTKTDDKTATFNKDTNNKNIWHSLQFNGGINGAPHFLKLNVQTDNVGGAEHEVATDYFLVKLTKTGESTPVFAKRYQAGRGKKDLYINFAALPGFNEYKLEVTKSRSDLTVQVHGMEFYSGSCSDKGQEENPVFFTDVKTIVSSLKPIYQPIYGTTFDGLAKEYIPIANIPIGEIEETHVATSTTRHYKVIEDNLKVNGKVLKETLKNPDGKLPSQWGATTTNTTVTGTGYKNLYVSGHSDEKDPSTRKVNNIAYILGSNNYTVDPVKGLNISQYGRAQMVEYLNGTVGDFPTKGMLAFKFEGTCDFTLLAENDITYSDDGNGGRSTLKIYYTNDQLDGELKELKEWWFYGTRSEVGGNDNIKNGDASHEEGNSLNVLSANIRLPQLGKDGTCTVFVTYEGRKNNGVFSHESGDDNKIWIKGFVIKRPDLKVTIGRTDELYKGQNRGGEENTKLTRFGVNKPYIWSFENVGFNNTRRRTVDGELEDDTQEKKVNVNDWRTYVCGGTDDSFDHLLVYSDVKSSSKDDKAQFDGRVAGQEHIEFRKPSQYLMKDDPEAVTDGRLEFNPITSNGLKVNVTGSGWFKIKCSAPNGKVKMKVFSSTNYGISYTNLLREFVVDNSKHPSSSTGEEEHRWGEYTVYLKGHVEREWTNSEKMKGFWDGDKIKFSEDDAANAEEKVRMSLYVVFDKIDDVDYKEDGDPSGADATAQLNIHQLSWLNEEPADYVFQREEDPKLLTEWQEIKRNDETVLYWKAGNDDDTKYKMLKENNTSTYDRLGQMTTNISGSKGVNSKSPGGYASTSVPSDAGSYDAYWDIAAPASTGSHTEAAYARGNIAITDESPQYVKSGANEFSIPISGSFVRICAMKNTYVVAHVIPGAANGDVYVLDETGAPIGFDGSTEDGKRRGYIATMLNTTDSGDEKKSGDATIRIDLCVNAGKEYFICAKDASISLARLEVQDWRYKPTKAAATLAVVDNNKDAVNTNSKIITDAYNAGNFYMDAKLTRKIVADKWISLVLPFSMNEKKFEEIFGEGAKCIHFTDVDIPNKTVKLTHHYYNMIVAGRPVFVLPTKDVKDASDNFIADIKDVTLQAKNVSTYSTPDGKFEFFASYDNETMKRNDLFMNNNNAIKFLTDVSASYPGMRSFIKNVNGPDFYTIIGTSSSASSTKAAFFNFCDIDEDSTTGIEELITAEYGENVIVVKKSTKVYDLMGNVVAEGADISNLPAGIYIVNGKKYVVK